MKRIVILTEEASMKETLTVLLPKLDVKNFLILAFQGKSDLERQIPIKLNGWKEPNSVFIILRDNDGGNCKGLKGSLLELIPHHIKDRCIIRIVCQELESWFLGDLRAVYDAGLGASQRIATQQSKQKFRQPDNLTNAKEELKKIAPGYKQLSGSRAIAGKMNMETNRSESFHQFVSGLKRLAG